MWQRCISKKSDKFQPFICTLLTLNLLFLHKDELWSYLGKKQKQRWVFIGFEVESRFWINVELGSRTTQSATKRGSGIKKYLKPFSADKPLKIATDNTPLTKTPCNRYSPSHLMGIYKSLSSEFISDEWPWKVFCQRHGGKFYRKIAKYGLHRTVQLNLETACVLLATNIIRRLQKQSER